MCFSFIVDFILFHLFIALGFEQSSITGHWL